MAIEDEGRGWRMEDAPTRGESCRCEEEERVRELWGKRDI